MLEKIFANILCGKKVRSVQTAPFSVLIINSEISSRTKLHIHMPAGNTSTGTAANKRHGLSENHARRM